jgi:adenosylcobyric acid synthase
MNPVLLKPVRGQGSQLVLMGRPQGTFSTAQYFRRWPGAAKAAQAAWASLAAEHDALVMEGAGSPAEVNLAHRDLANLETARFSGAPFMLVVDIERGGSFAAIIGTLALLPDWLRPRLVGVVFNKFRGDARLLDGGLRWLKARRIPCLGIVPWLDGLVLEQEDSLGLPTASSGSKGGLGVQVLRHRHLANFNDLLPLAGERGVRLTWVEPGAERPRPALVVLPGSKDSLADLKRLQDSGEAARLKAWAAQGTWILGLCGGLQMLGRGVSDPHGVDGGRFGARAQGLGLLDLATVMGRDKVLRQRKVQARTRLGAVELSGYEIHHGRSQAGPGVRVEAVGPRRQPLLYSDGGGVWGSYLHGILDQGGFRQAFLQAVAVAQGRRFNGSSTALAADREASLAAWAAHLRAHLDLRWLPQAPGKGAAHR